MAEISNLSEIRQSRRRAVRGFAVPPGRQLALHLILEVTVDQKQGESLFRDSGSKEVRRREGSGKNDNTG
jgi:hypothetical protein